MKIDQLKVGVILSYISIVLSTVVSLVYTPIMLRILGQSEYGLYTLVSSVVAYLGLLNFGFGSAYIRYYTKYKVCDDDENVARLNGMFMAIFCVLGIIALAAGGVLVANIQSIFKNGLTIGEVNTARILMIIMVINMAISFPAIIFTTYITANEKYIVLKVIGICKTVINPFVMLPILLMGYGSIGMVLISTIINIIIEFLSMLYCFKKLKMKFIFHGFQLGLLKELWIFCSYIFFNMITDQINWNTDKFLLGIFKGSTAVAIYGVAAQINNYYLQFSTAISSVFVPRINLLTALKTDDKTITKLFTKVGRIQFIILSLILTGFIIFGREFVFLWAGEGYEEAYLVGLILIIPVTIPSIQNLGLDIQRARNKHKFRAIVYFLISVLNIFISIPLCKSFGPSGAAIGTAIALILGNGIAMNIYYHKKIKIDMIYFWHSILKFAPSLIFPIIVGVVIKKIITINNYLMLFLCIAVYVVAFAISMWLTGLNEEEKQMIKK